MQVCEQVQGVWNSGEVADAACEEGLQAQRAGGGGALNQCLWCRRTSLMYLVT